MRPDRPSRTSLAVALAMLAARTRRPSQTILTDSETGLLRASFRRIGGPPRLCAAIASARACTGLVRFIEWCTVPGIIQHFGARKKLIADQVREALGHGCSRVVVLGAGLDLLALQLAQTHGATRLVEVDHPSTQPLKRDLLAAAPEGRAVSLVAADLATDAGWRALDAALADGHPTVAVAEGLSMYLPPADWHALLDHLAGVAAVRTLIFTFLEPGPGRPASFISQTWALHAFLRLAREQFQWGVHRAALAAELEPHAWGVERILGPESFPAPLCGEYIAVCHRLPTRETSPP